jgi:hypothetical protein
MPVLSVRTRALPTLSNVALKFGVQADVVDTDGPDVYVDLIGSDYRILTVACRVRADILAYLDNIEHGERVRHYPARPSH